jgi:hypothetical protein
MLFQKFADDPNDCSRKQDAATVAERSHYRCYSRNLPMSPMIDCSRKQEAIDVLFSRSSDVLDDFAPKSRMLQILSQKSVDVVDDGSRKQDATVVVPEIHPATDVVLEICR